jgi:SAM-dependent methyltransferase
MANDLARLERSSGDEVPDASLRGQSMRFVFALPHEGGNYPYDNPFSAWCLAYRRGYVRAWLRELGVSGPDVLDVACGIRPIVNGAVGIDLSGGVDAHNLPFEDGSFEAVTCLEFLEHSNAPSRVLEEIHRVLRPGGRAIVSTPFPTPFWDWLVWPVWERTLGRKWLHSHVGVMPPSELSSRVAGAGFRVERHICVCFCDQVLEAVKVERR